MERGAFDTTELEKVLTEGALMAARRALASGQGEREEWAQVTLCLVEALAVHRADVREELLEREG